MNRIISSRITTAERHDIITQFKDNLIPMAALAKQYKVSRQTIYKTIKHAGIDTSKHKESITCLVCDKQFLKTRCLVKRSKHHFCCNECYYAWLKHGNGNPLIIHRQGARIARTILSKIVSPVK